MKRGTPEHPKTRRLAHALGIPLAGAVGILEMLRHFTASYAPRGNVGRWTDEEIAHAIRWPDLPPEHLIGALVECGFLDVDPEHRLVVHTSLRRNERRRGAS